MIEFAICSSEQANGADRGMPLQDEKEIYDRLREILGGQESVKLYLEFLKRNDKTDNLILKHSKVGI